jgi:hypothetical protein
VRRAPPEVDLRVPGFAFPPPIVHPAPVTSPRIHTLSKSDFKLARTCASKLYYRELGYPDNRDEDPYLDWLAEGGYMVEVLAKQLFPEGVAMEYDSRDPRPAAEDSLKRLRAAESITLFEPTLLHERRLARVDILKKSPRGFDLYEVKSSSFDPDDAAKRIEKTGSPFRSMKAPFGIHSDWEEYLEDVTYQVTILRDLFPGVLIRAHLILMDKSKVAAHDGMPSWFQVLRRPDGSLHTAKFIGDAEAARRDPLTIGLDVTGEVVELEPVVRAATTTFLASLDPEPRRIPVMLGSHCRSCEFRVAKTEEKNGFRECWGKRADAEPHVLDIYRGGDLREALITRGANGWDEITEADLSSRTGKVAAWQRRHIEQVRLNQEWIGDALGSTLKGARFPLHFIDFEAARIAVPHHKGMRPYGQVAFQWSCHTLAAPGEALTHGEYLNLDPVWPNEQFARTLRDAIGDEGTVLVWSHFERSVLESIAEELTALGSGDQSLAAWLRTTSVTAANGGRQLDMLKLCRDEYYHPLMRSSYSIKAVLDAIWKSSPEVRARFGELEKREVTDGEGPYASLPPAMIAGAEEAVREGTGAMRAYFRMAYGAEREDAAAVQQWSELLRTYCRLDTLAMVLIWEHWRRVAR